MSAPKSVGRTKSVPSWDHRETTAAGPGDNTSHAKARRTAKRTGNKLTRRSLQRRLNQQGE